MKSILILTICIAQSVWAQTASPVMAPETVVATTADGAITAGDLMTVYRMSPPEAQKNFLKDPKAMVETYALLKKLAAMGEKARLHEKSPLKDELEASRRQFLAVAQASAARDSLATTIQAADQKKYYEDHWSRYSQAKVKVLFVSTKKGLSEIEAKAKVDKVLARIRSGADFVKLVKEHSDDADSVARDGDFGTPIKGSDSNMPADVLKAIFALKPGQVSDPLRVSTGFYVFRLEEIATEPYDKVRDDIFIEIQQKRFDEWRDQLQKSLDVKIVNDSFFKAPASAPKTP